MKLNGFFLIVGICLGAFLFSKLSSKPQTIASSEKISEKKSGVIKKYAPPIKAGDAPVLISEEFYVSDSKSEVKNDKPQDNLLFLTDTKLKSAEVLFRIEHLHIGLGYNFLDKEILYKLGYSTRIF
jgi:hypothetical protein